MYILGISAFYHDSAACLLNNNDIVAAAQEERFTRIKNDAQFPVNAIKYCLQEAGITLHQVDHVVFYEKPFLKFERLVETYLAMAPKGIISFLKAMPLWIKSKIFQKKIIIDHLTAIDAQWKYTDDKLLFTEHHQSHAASAFFPSPYKKALIITADGAGEWTTTSVWMGDGNAIKLLKEIKFPHSIGLLYSAFTYYLGFKVNSDEYKVMGLAPYGEPRYTNLIREHLIDIKPDGSFRLNMAYFNYATGLTMTNNKFNRLFGNLPRKPDEEIRQFHMDIASSIQQVTEQVMITMVNDLVKTYGAEYTCLAGGVALNCVVNGKLLNQCDINGLWIQPAAGDAGGALGAAYFVYHQYLNNKRITGDQQTDKMQNALLGPAFTKDEIITVLKNNNIAYETYQDDAFYTQLAAYLNNGLVAGWFSGRMEFGPRSLGARSIIADSRDKDMQRRINMKVKFRESFRPFAPAVLEECADIYFNLKQKSPYMLLVDQIQERHRKYDTQNHEGFDRLKSERSVLPAVTHIDYSARLQTVNEKDNPAFYKVIKAFYNLTGCPILVNTSFNVNNQPIVCTPEDALQCFLATDIDLLVFENIIIKKSPAV